MISIKLTHVDKHLSGKLILSDISFAIKENSSTALLGPVGSGKTTVLNLICGLLTADLGRVMVLNSDMSNPFPLTQTKINYASSSLRLNGYASIRENLTTYALIYGVGDYENKIRVLCQFFQISHLLESGIKIYRLSAGENTKVNLCKAFLNEPEVVLFDEITAHLDGKSIEIFIDFLNQYRKNKPLTILSASHQTDVIRRYCQYAVFLKKGKVIYAGKMPKEKILPQYYG